LDTATKSAGWRRNGLVRDWWSEHEHGRGDDAPICYRCHIGGDDDGRMFLRFVGSILGPLLAGIWLSGGTAAPQVIFYMAPFSAVAALAVNTFGRYPHGE
jgi:hypothetical protein